MNRLFRSLGILTMALLLLVRPALAQSILRDAETEAFFKEAAKPLAEAANVNPHSLEMILINDKDINAFVAGGQNIFIHSGLLIAADNANQLQGVIAHEMGHIAGGHIVRIDEGAKAATGITILSLLLGAAAVAAGAGDAGMAIMSGGQSVAMDNFLAFSRTQESTADQAGASYLEKAHISGRGSVDFFRKLQNQEFRLAIPQDNSYARTHPLTGDRIDAMEARLKGNSDWDKPSDPALEARFQRIKAKLIGFINEPSRTLQLYPETDQSIPALYARAYAYHRNAEPEKAAGEAAKLLARAPNDPYFLELEGQILLESGKVEESIPPLRRAVALAPNEPLIASLLGHALIAAEKPEYTQEAKNILRAAITRDNQNPFAWYQLGVAYTREGDEPRAHLASAERYNLEGNVQQALIESRQAMAGLKQGTPDWLRASDIEMVSRNALSKKNKNKGR